MKRESRIYKKKKGFRRGFALLMTAALVICGSNLTVLAEENDSNEKVCICESRCNEEEIQEECPVCAENYEDCMYQENPESEEGGEEISGQENDQDAAEGDNTDVNGSGDEGAGNDENEEETNENESINDDMKEGDPANDDNIVEELDKEELLKGTDLPEMQGALSSNAMEMEAAEGGTFGEEGIETYAVGDRFEDSSGIIYKVVEDDQVEVIGHRDGRAVSGELVIPEDVSNGSDTYRVTSIGYQAFWDYSLTRVEIPNSVINIGEYAFSDCENLTSIVLSDGLTNIGFGAFRFCTGLVSIEIPDSVTNIGELAFSACTNLTSVALSNSMKSIGEGVFEDCDSLVSIEIPDSVISIEDYAFCQCYNLANIKIPNSVTKIGRDAFSNCHSLTKVKISSNVTSIGFGAFSACSELNELQIVVLSGEPIGVPVVETEAFFAIPEERLLIFLGEDGTPLTGDALEAAQAAYQADVGSEDKENFWWGWKIGDSDIPSVKTIKIKVKKDNSEWADHTKQFGLKRVGDPDAELITDLTSVADGEYRIFDITSVDAIVDTEINITVNGGGAEASVDYYTVTFCDGDQEYGSGTPQAPQVILRGKMALQPEEPSKPGYRFRQWTTINHGSEVFRFDLPVTQKSSVYADWIEEAAAEYIVAASAGEGGKIFPEGNVRVAGGGAQTFEITPNEGYQIKNVIADDMDVTDKLTDSVASGMARAQAGTGRYYTFLEVREDHRIQVVFETETDGGSGGNGENTGNGSGDNAESNDNTGSVNENPGGENAREGVTAGNADGRNSGGADRENGGSAGTPSKNAEPKTGDLFQVEIYATVAMVAGLAYLMLRFADREGGMTEDEKQELIMKMILWAKRGSHLRKYAVLAPIFILLVYYHSIGKSVYVEWENSLMVGEGDKPNRIRRSRIQK